MSLRAKRSLAALLALGIGIAAPLVSEEVMAHRLGMAGPPVLYATLVVAAVGAAVATWYSSGSSWRATIVHGGLALVGALATFVYLFSQTQA